MELIGEYDASGLAEPIFLARRADGQMIQMSSLLFGVARHLDGRRTLEQVAEAAGRELGRRLEPDDLEYLLDRKLKPAGLVVTEDGQGPPLERRDPMLALRFKARVVPARLVDRAAALVTPLFFAPAVIALLAGVAAAEGWLFFLHGVAQPVRQVVLQPHLSLLVVVLLIASTAFHELGHAAACRYGGAKPGPIGVGLYLAWPVFYSDVTDSYRLDRAGRLRTDLGGVYFNLVFALLVTATYLVTRFEPLLVVVALEPIEVLHQFFPFVRLDGYYVISDLIGVPDLFQRIRPTLASLMPNRPLHPQVAGLKPWARVAVAAWVLIASAIILALYVLLIVGLPRLAATAWQSVAQHAALIATAFRAGRPVLVVLDAVEELFLLLPILALGLTLARLGRHLVTLLWRFSARRPATRFALAIAAAGALGFAAGVLWQADRYRPIQPWEHGTLPTAPLVVDRVSDADGAGPAAPRVWSGPPAPGPRQPALPASSPTAAGVAPSAAASATSPAPSARPSSTAAPSPTPSAAPSPNPSPSPI